jgi:hypothetical protein
MGGNGISIKSSNFILFRSAEAVVDNGPKTTVVTGFRVPLFPGKYRILVEHISYGTPDLPKNLDATLEKVKKSLGDPYGLPKKIPIREY